MKILLKLAANAAAGTLIVFLLIGAGFSGSIFGVVIAVAICCAIGYSLSYFSARRDKTSFWLYGAAYILLPMLFIYSSGEGDETATAKMRLIWTGILSIIYGASLVGGIVGAKKAAAKKE